jgi:hypothetical protein
MNFKVKFFHLISLLCFGIMLNACIGNTAKDKVNTEKETSPTQEIIGIYESCTVYTGSTKYYFKPEKGEMIEVSALNKGMEDEEKYRIKMPDNLIDDSKDLEGLPGANPKMVGKKFKLIYNEQNEVIEIKLIK